MDTGMEPMLINPKGNLAGNSPNGALEFWTSIAIIGCVRFNNFIFERE